MNTEQLKKGQDIQSDIQRLKSALSELLRDRLFRIDDPTMYGNEANPFLAEVEVKTRTFASNAITNKIKELQKEFDKL